ncbi:hypothetical protein PEDI_39800 [Persicobacter diffluens]|uniref:Uncharacterized protein n=1 Tax=Persicobacter diffluens TaxID=981 RepID=A0AAN4W160_9BACT|nr:hypothetical protein PEDI_39800 [Persicobacter diffluens]
MIARHDVLSLFACFVCVLSKKFPPKSRSTGIIPLFIKKILRVMLIAIYNCVKVQMFACFDREIKNEFYHFFKLCRFFC